MSSYGELIQALKVLKNVKEKRQGIKTLSTLCANRAFQVRIVQRGGWRDAILPLIISLDEDCRKYAALAIANLSTSEATHPQLLQEDVLRHLVPILISEEVQEVVVYVLNALGNFAVSPITWPTLQQLNAIKPISSLLDQGAEREEVIMNTLFCLANMTGDPYARLWMMNAQTYRQVWAFMTENRNIRIMQYSLALLRGLAVEVEAQEVLPKLGIVPHLVGIFTSTKANEFLKTLVLDIILHLSFRRMNSAMLLQPNVMDVIVEAARGEANSDYIQVGMAIIANLCENIEHHDEIIESPLFEIIADQSQNDHTDIQMHVIRAMMHIALSPKYHHVVLATGVMANVCPIAMTSRLTVEMRANALQMMAAVCATHPTTPTEEDVMNLLFLICNNKENIEIRRASMLVIANASSDVGNANTLMNKSYVESLIITLSRSRDVVLVDYLMQFFHNICKLDGRAGTLLMRCGYRQHMFTYERLESLSITSAIYLCDTCRSLAEDPVVRTELLQPPQGMIIKAMLDAWAGYIEDPQLAPHLALMASAFAYHTDTHDEFVLQGGVRLVVQLYSQSQVEHVRLCCLLTLLYLAESPRSRSCIAQERGISMLLAACENETHVDLVTNSLKALLPFASSDDYRPELGQEGAIDTFAAYLFSDQLSLQQLAVFLLQNVLELRVNRRIFLGLAEEKRCEEDYMEPLVRFLPKVFRGPPKRIVSMNKSKKKEADEGATLTPHDPFIVRSIIHCIALLSLEYNKAVLQRFVDLQVPAKLYDLFYSEQIDRSSGEAILLFFANCLHTDADMQGAIMKGLEVIPMLLAAREMDFSPHTNTRCLSALLSIARVPNFRRMVLGQLDLIMASVNANLSTDQRDEDFYATTAVHCALLCELARASAEFHERMAKAGVVEAFLVFMTVAGRGVNDEMCIELLMSAVFGIAALVSSPKTGEQCMASLLFPATRLQLFLSLLRLPSSDINATFHAGTIGVRTLQRTAAPEILPEELQVDGLDLQTFMDCCGAKPAAFVYRNVVRTLGLLLAHPEMAERVLQAIAPPRVVPTCLFALRDGGEDIYVQVYGYLLVATFSKHRGLVPGFVHDASVINELLTGCRRGSSASNEDEVPPVTKQLDTIGRGSTLWTAKSVAQNKYLLSMVAMTNFAESIREVYRIDEDLPSNLDGGTSEMSYDPETQLTLSNRMFMKRLAAICLQDLDTDSILNAQQMTEMQEFSALLKVIVLHNSFVSHISLAKTAKGGEVRVERIGVSANFEPDRPKGIELVPKELREIFKTQKQVQIKCEGLLDIVERCLDTNRGRALVTAIVECLSGLTFLSPMSIFDPFSVYKVLSKAPEWLHSSLCCLLCNSLADESRIERFLTDDSGELLGAESDYLFPLISTSTIQVRHHLLGALANLGTRSRFIDFILGSGVMRVIRPLADRAYFVEHFGLVLELTRLLTNITCLEGNHREIVTENTIGFLRDVLKYSSRQILYDLKGAVQHKVQYSYITALFEEDDLPPLGLRIRWEVPPYVSEVLPGTPAARLEEQLLAGDELVEVNGTDITEMEQTEIEPFFETRPLQLVFRRAPGGRRPGDDGHQAEEPEIARIGRLDAYGDQEQYLECFNLALLTLHNLATDNKNHMRLLAEPKILDTALEIIKSEVLSPSLRRLTFSLLTCLAEVKDISGRIFQDMADYFRSCEKGDPSLQKYILLCANLFYTSMKPEEVIPDIGMLTFVGHLASLESAASSNTALVEVLHGMSRAPREWRKNFICRETLVVTVNFLENRDQWDVQLRAFEAAYFLTLGGCEPTLWAALEMVPRMAKAASKLREFAGRDKELQGRADGLFELTLRTADMCLAHQVLLPQLSLPELDRYLMDLLNHESKDLALVQCAVHFMTGLMQSPLGSTCWTRWRSMGIGDRIVSWFKNHKGSLCSIEETAPVHRGGPRSTTMGECLDTMLDFLVFAIDMDVELVATLVADEVVACIAYRIINIAQAFRAMYAKAGRTGAAPDTSRLSAPFRCLAQLLTALAANGSGLAAMGKLGLAGPLAALLDLPPADFRMPVLIILCTLCGQKDTCEALMHNPSFLQLLKRLEGQLQQPGTPLLQEELEYLVCILDRSCCYAELATLVQDKMLNLLFILPAKAETMDAQVMALRALARCAFVNPRCLEELPVQGVACMHYIMAATSCLRSASPEDPDSSASIARRKMIAGLTEALARSPHEAQLVSHFSRAALCETVSVSRGACFSMFQDLDILGLLQSLVGSFEHAVARIENEREDVEMMSAEVLNNMVGMLHVLLCVIFRQRSPGQGETPAAKAIPPEYIVRSLTKVFDALHRHLRFSELANPQDGHHGPREASSKVAKLLVEDIRVLFYLTALLREICAAPVHSMFVGVIRTPEFYQALSASIQIATTRLQWVKAGKLSKTLYGVPQSGGARESPLAKHLEEFDLALVFEHLMVCLRHSLTQAMFVQAAVDAFDAQPWVWAAQESLSIHRDAFTWIPDMLKSWPQKPAIQMEVVRYICAAATFYMAPHAPPQDPDSPEGRVPLLAVDTFSLLKPHILDILAGVLETSEEECSLSLAALAISNLAGYEQLHRQRGEVRELPIEGLHRIAASVVKLLKRIPKLPRESGERCILYAYRTLSSFLAMTFAPLTCAVMQTGALDAIKMTFDFFFRDGLKIGRSEDYAIILQNLVLLMRNWSTAGCLADTEVEQHGPRIMTAVRLREGQKALDHNMEVPSLLNLLVKVAFKLTNPVRDVPEATDPFLDGVYEDVLVTLRTLLKRGEQQKSAMAWKQVDQREFEKLLEQIREHRYRRSGEFEDEELISILYLMTKQAFLYERTYFPDFLMEVAYGGHREEHSIMQDIAAVCCAIISTQNAKEKVGPTCNVANVVKDHAQFIHALERVPDSTLQLWHYRLLTQWSQRPRVLDEVSADARALKFVVDKLLDPLLGRYSVVVVHNISVLRHGPLLTTAGHLSVLCEAYKGLRPGAPASGSESQRRLLRRLLLASVRNCALNASNLDVQLAENDLQEIVKLSGVVEAPDIPLYMSVLLHLCQGSSPERVMTALPAHGPLVELLISRMLEQAWRGEKVVGLNDLDYYTIITTEEEEFHQRLDEEEEDHGATSAALSASPAAFGPQRNRLMGRSYHSPKGSPSPNNRGLGKKYSLYQLQRMRREAGNAPTTFTVSGKREVKLVSAEEKSMEQEFVYFATAEVLTHTTFREVVRKEKPKGLGSTVKVPPPPKEPPIAPVAEGDAAVQAALADAFHQYPINSYLRALREQVELHEKKRVTLTDLFMQVSAKFILHCFSSGMFRPQMETVANLEVLADLTPFFLKWPNEDVQHLMSEVALHAGLHRYSQVTNFLVESYHKFPELTCALLTRALVDPEAVLSARQAALFVRTFIELLRSKALSWTGLIRLSVGLEVGLISDHPEGFCAYLLQVENGLLGDLLEQLYKYSESGTVKQSMVVALALTAGAHYKARSELDQFVLRVLDLAGPLLEGEFVLFFPVLYRIAMRGGKRIKGPLLTRNLHMRVARLLEESVNVVENEDRKREVWESAPEEVVEQGARLSARQKIQWMMAFFTALAGAGLPHEVAALRDGKTPAHDPDLHFDSFVCVDLLPILVRILRKEPQMMESMSVLFLMATVAQSPCIGPFMPDVLRVSERSLPSVLNGPDSPIAVAAAARAAARGFGPGAGTWEHLRLPPAHRVEAATRRSFLHVLGNAGFTPETKPALLAASKVWEYLSRLQPDAELFEDPAAPLHTKAYALARVCSRVDNHRPAMEVKLLEILKQTYDEVMADRGTTDEVAANAPDLRLPWLSCVVSLAGLSGTWLLKVELAMQLFKLALQLAQELLADCSKLRGSAKGMHLALECQQALGYAIGNLSAKREFAPLRSEYTLFLLGLMCSAPLQTLRTTAGDHLVRVLCFGHEPVSAGLVFTKTPCLISFRQMVGGPLDELAISCAKVMQALIENAGYAVHVHLLPNLEAIMHALGSPTSSAPRCVQLAELFVALTKDRTYEVLDALIEVPDITPLLGLARSTQATRRELVLKWLEAYGSSLYEIDEVNEVFASSTLRGLLHLATRSTLELQQAQDLRRTLFGLILRRVETWRASLFGVREFLSEALITALLPMCEKQPDLVAAAAALLHSSMTHNEPTTLERVWSGGHFAWLCQRLTHKSRAQLFAAAAATRAEPSAASVNKAWEKHADLTAAQGMILRVIWQLYDMFPNDLNVKAVNGELLLKNWTEYLTYYCHYAWPLRETGEVERATDGCIMLAMQLFARVAVDVTPELQLKLIQQGALGLCCTVLLPNPQEQERFRRALCPRPGAAPEDPDTSEALVLPGARMVAGAVANWLLQHPEAYRWFSDRRVAQYSVGMFVQLHHWRNALLENMGSLSVLATVSLLERYATLFIAILSSLHVDWCLNMVGLGEMRPLMWMFLELWGKHANKVVKHHALRLFSTFAQVHVLYVSVMADEEKAEATAAAVHRTFGTWDVRDLRHVLRLLNAALAHALAIPLLPETTLMGVVRALRDRPECEYFRLVLDDGGASRANREASRHLLLSRFLSQVLGWCERPGDAYSTVWALWMVFTLFEHEEKLHDAASGPPHRPPVPPATTRRGEEQEDEAILVFSDVVDEKHLSRRMKMMKEQQAVLERTGGDAAERPGIALLKNNLPSCRTTWIRSSTALCNTLAIMAGNCLDNDRWRLAQQMACAASAKLFFELPQFQQISVETLNGRMVVSMFQLPTRALNLVAILLAAVLGSFRLPLKAQNMAGEFLKRFYDLSGTLIEGLAACGEGPYDMIARWLGAAPGSLPCDGDFRGLVAFMTGQCVCPPLAVIPSLELEGRNPDSPDGKGAPPVAECGPPPAALLDKLALEVIQEEQRLRRAQVDGQGPLFSSLLCHLLYSLAVMVPLHPKAAANSAAVRGAAFAQLMKIQNMVAQGVPASSLYDPADGKRAKLFLYVRATACIRSALQSITGSWLAADFGARFAIQEEGGRDFIQYCTKHIQQVYNSKTALTRVYGTPWERVMLSQGPTQTIAELLMMICSTDANLKEVSKLGGEHALHALSRYGETTQIKQQATMLLTKLAVMQQF